MSEHIWWRTGPIATVKRLRPTHTEHRTQEKTANIAKNRHRTPDDEEKHWTNGRRALSAGDRATNGRPWNAVNWSIGALIEVGHAISPKNRAQEGGGASPIPNQAASLQRRISV